jgi:hypothetical protein
MSKDLKSPRPVANIKKGKFGETGAYDWNGSKRNG